PIVQSIKEWVDEEYEAGRVTVITDEELINLILITQEALGITLVNEAR
ncbi:MAG: hypothetical protein K0S04_1008, partial [Herbinix sp.]|nr:hypothetical protein [Herbinix sp.]